MATNVTFYHSITRDTSNATARILHFLDPKKNGNLSKSPSQGNAFTFSLAALGAWREREAMPFPLLVAGTAVATVLYVYTLVYPQESCFGPETCTVVKEEKKRFVPLPAISEEVNEGLRT